MVLLPLLNVSGQVQVECVSISMISAALVHDTAIRHIRESREVQGQCLNCMWD